MTRDPGGIGLRRKSTLTDRTPRASTAATAQSQADPGGVQLPRLLAPSTRAAGSGTASYAWVRR
jgi:hypothetical protein